MTIDENNEQISQLQEIWLYFSVDKSGGFNSEIQWTVVDDLAQVLAEDALVPISVTPELEADTMMGSPGFWAVE